MIEGYSDPALEKLPSNKTFGFFFSGVFLLSAVNAYWKHLPELQLQAFAALTLIFLILALVWPSILRPLNQLWFKLGLFLGRLVSPLVFSLIFFLLITPVALVSRLFRRDALRLRKRKVSRFWIQRDPAGQSPESFKNQY